MSLIPIAVFWVLLLVGMTQRDNRLHLKVLFCTMAMGSFAVIPINLSAGMTLTGPPVIAGAMMFKSLFRIGALDDYLNSAVQIKILGLLSLFWVVSCAVTFIAPRYFFNDVEIIPMKLKVVGIMGSDLLTPTKQNLSQALYITISVISVFMFTNLFRSARSRENALEAFRFGASTTVLTGALDALSSYLPITPFLELFRTGGYAMMTDKVVNGYKRVVGLMPEAAAFGSICLFFLCFLYFSRFLLLRESPRTKAYYYFLMVALAGMLVLSMSSSAYVALGVLCGVAGLEWWSRHYFARSDSVLKHGLRQEFLCCAIGVGVIVFAFAAIPPLHNELIERIDRLILSKTDSQSFEERSMWNTVSLQSLWGTNGLGCGLGGTRSSNRCIAIFSNTGIAGGILFYGFVCQVMLRSPGKSVVEISVVHAVRWGFAPMFVLDFLVGTTPDFGLANAWMFAMVTGIYLGSGQNLVVSGEELEGENLTGRRSDFPNTRWVDTDLSDTDLSDTGLSSVNFFNAN